MTKILTGLALASTLTLAGGDIAPIKTITPTQVEVSKDFYVGLSTVLGNSVTNKDFEWFNASSVGIQGGYTFYRDGKFDTSVEARYTSIYRDVADYGDVQNYGVFIKPSYDLTVAKVYGLVGYTATDFKQDKLDTDGWAVGIGASKEVYPNVEVFVDYVINDDSSLTGIREFDVAYLDNQILTLGVNYKF